MTIVYESATGFTAEYARMLGEAAGLPALPARDAEETLPQGARVCYLGWLRAGSIFGLRRASARFRVAGACGVGLRPCTDGALADLKKSNKLETGPLFYLQGGYAPKRLRGVNRWIMGMVTRSMAKQIAAQSRGGAQEERMLAVLRSGGSLVDREQLRPVLEWLETTEKG